MAAQEQRQTQVEAVEEVFSSIRALWKVLESYQLMAEMVMPPVGVVEGVEWLFIGKTGSGGTVGWTHLVAGLRKVETEGLVRFILR